MGILKDFYVKYVFEINWLSPNITNIILMSCIKLLATICVVFMSLLMVIYSKIVGVQYVELVTL